MKKELISLYELKKSDIKKRLQGFKSLNEKEYYSEFLFCLLTPQSNAKKCWQAVEQLLSLNDWNLNDITEVLSKKTRFHNTKALRVLNSNAAWKKVKPLLQKENKKELRNEIAELVNGYGLKEAGHFLRNIGNSNNEIAILDRHILRNLKKEGVITDDKIKSRKNYIEIEQKFLNFAKNLGISPDELDLLWWSKENGEIFK